MDSLRLFIKRIVIVILRLSGDFRRKSLTPDGIAYSLSELSEFEFLYQAKAAAVKRRLPHTIGKIHKNFISNLNTPIHDLFVIRAKNWRVWGNQGAVLTNKNLLLKTVSREFGNKHHSISFQFKLVPPQILNSHSVVLATSGGSVYYHWMFDIMPRLLLLEKSGIWKQIDHWIINYTAAKFQEEMLVRAGVDPRKIIRSNDHWSFHIQAEQLVVPSLISPLDCPSLEACNYLRRLYSIEISAQSEPIRLYIQRRTNRRIANEEELLPFLMDLGFQVVNPEHLTVSEQAALFAAAEVVVGPHGAGFTNIVFCRPDTLVIDLFSAEWINPCYWIICEHLNLRYGYLIGKRFKQAAKGKGADIMIDIQELKDLFVKMKIDGLHNFSPIV